MPVLVMGSLSLGIGILLGPQITRGLAALAAGSASWACTLGWAATTLPLWVCLGYRLLSRDRPPRSAGDLAYVAYALTWIPVTALIRGRGDTDQSYEWRLAEGAGSMAHALGVGAGIAGGTAVGMLLAVVVVNRLRGRDLAALTLSLNVLILVAAAEMIALGVGLANQA